jgi:hypothetical protein
MSQVGADSGVRGVAAAVGVSGLVTKKDEINPAHYRTGKIEVIDFIEDQKLNYHLGNVVKYICRADHKGSRETDLKKAQWYLARAISKL